LWLSAADNAATPNYAFDATQVQSFLHAKLFGAPLAASTHSTAQQLAAYTGHVTTTSVLLVAVPLMILAGVATHFTARAAAASQLTPIDRQARVMRLLSLWVFPAGAVIGGPFLPVAVLVYWLSNNAWTLAQQHWVKRGIGSSAPTPPAAAPAAVAPKPGARPTARRNRSRRRR
jgi:YidC/Oxa1 family membrane protein insertase